MIGFLLGLLFGAALASGSLYAIYLWAHLDEKSATAQPAAPANIAPPAGQHSSPPSATPVGRASSPPSATETAWEGRPTESCDAPAAREAPKEAPAEESPEAPLPFAENLWLGRLSSRVEDEIDTHSFRIEEISASLREAREGEPDMVLDAASRIMLANEQLQAELAAARNEINQHREKEKLLAAEARTDVLTGLANRRAFIEELDCRFDQWRRQNVPLSMIMVDIDHFKSVNDRYTHAGGDAALRHIGDLLLSALRQMDIPARYGGEEFAIILPGTKMGDAINVAERLRATIAAKPFTFEALQIPITASLGLATSLASDTPALLVERADEALYAAKQAGRNRAYVHDGDSHLPINSDQALVRHPFRDLQQVAPYRLGGPLPTARDFHAVRCYDLSVKGISFLSSTPPDHQAFVIRLGNPPQSRYMISSIANVTAVSSGDEQEYRIGCTFVSRLDPDEIIAGPVETELSVAQR